jgi:HPt (histidine-containing phosphotransfer) domain-containing protein
MIDWNRVEELRDEIGAEGFAEVIDMFLDEAMGALNALAAGLPAGEVETQLHFLKGSALNLGLRDLAAICQDGERRAAGGDAASVDIPRLSATFQASRKSLLAWLSAETVAGAA